MTYEDAKRIVDAVEEQKRAAFYHNEIESLRLLLREYPDAGQLLDYSLIANMARSKIHSKNARILLGIEGS